MQGASVIYLFRLPILVCLSLRERRSSARSNLLISTAIALSLTVVRSSQRHIVSDWKLAPAPGPRGWPRRGI